MREVSWLSLDVFDTALLRKVSRPTDVFRVMQSEAGKITGNEAVDFFSARVSAETEARLKIHQQGLGRGEVPVEEIYNQLAVRLNLSPEQRKRLLELELKSEKELTYANPLILDLHQAAIEMKKKVFFLSDMYLSAGQIQELLAAAGYKNPIVYVSSEHDGNKGSGQLYDIVRGILNIPRGDVLHIGDRFRADYIRPKLKGWRSLYLRSPMATRADSSPQAGTEHLASSLSRGLITQYNTRRAEPGQSERAAWSSIGYTAAGPLYFSFALWLYAKARESGIRHFYFCARDGFSLVKAFEILNQAWNLDVQTTYLYASRKLLNQANIRRLDLDRLELLMPTPGLTLRDYVERCGYNATEHEKALRSLGFASLDTPLTTIAFGRFINPSYHEWLKKWLSGVGDDFLERCRKDRKMVLEYLMDQGVHRPGSFVVDIGWKGTLIKSSQEILQEADAKITLRSLFFGTQASAKRIVEGGGSVDSCFFHFGLPPKRAALAAECVELIELLFSAPHPTILGLQKTAEGIEPVYGKSEHTPQQSENLAAMLEAAYAFVQDAASVGVSADNFNAPLMTDDFMEEHLKRFLRNPTLSEARAVGSFGNWLGYGDKGSLRRFAQVPVPTPDGKAHLWELGEAYSGCIWKRGFLVQLSFMEASYVRLHHFIKGVYVASVSGTVWPSMKWILFKSE